jgi:hypothetical protein
MFFTFEIIMKTYFQKVVDSAEIASTTGVSFTINHITSVVISSAFGVLWLTSPAAVFFASTATAGMALNVPHNPSRGN